MPKEETDTKAAAVSNSPEAAVGASLLTPPAADDASRESSEKAAATADAVIQDIVTRVRVITKGPLGPKLIMPGEITSAPEYVAYLKVPGQKKVEAVK